MKKTDLALEAIQHKFAQALLDVDMVQQALPLFSTPADQLDGRLAFYRGNLSAIWSQALANAYPVLQKLVGVEFFDQMARAYGRAFPSQQGDLNHFGSELSKFLAHMPELADYPYFPDVATLEWQVHRAYYAADAEILSLPALLAAAGEGLQQARLGWHPAAQLHASDWASVAIWQAHQSEVLDQLPDNLRQASYALISRLEWRVVVLPIARADYLALQLLWQGGSLENALELALECDPAFDISNQLQRWFSADAFTSIL